MAIHCEAADEAVESDSEDECPPQASEGARPPTPTHEVLRQLGIGGAEAAGESAADLGEASEAESDGSTSARPVGHSPQLSTGSARGMDADGDGASARSTSSSVADAAACTALLREAMGKGTQPAQKAREVSEADEILELKMLLGRSPRKPQSFLGHGSMAALAVE